MAFNTNPGKQQFTASAGQTVFTFNFAIFSENDIDVYSRPTGSQPNDANDILLLTVDYTVSINGTSGGTVTLVSPASLNDIVTITRSLPVSRTTDYVTNGDLYADTIDADQDYQTYLIADGYTQLARSVKIPNSMNGVDLSLPYPISHGYIKWNASADGLENGFPDGTSLGYITYGLPASAGCGDLAVNTLDGGVYQWDCNTGTWELVAQSAGSGTGTVPLGVSIVTGLPNVGANGEIVFNQADGYFYGYINGVWVQMVSTPTGTVGIEVFASDPTTGNFEGRTIFNTTTNQLRKFTSGAYIQVVEPTTAAQSVADGSITTAKFASGITPIEIVDVLPTTGNFTGRTVLLTTDNLIYRYSGVGFSASIPTAALTGTITSTQIGANQITTGALAVGAVTADTIAANAITAGKIATNAITTGTIQAGAIGATEIATNAITSEKLNAGSVTASKIAALSIDASKIVAGSIGADQIAANAITAGKIAAGAVSANNIAAGTITATQIASGTITAAQLAAYSITSAKLDTNALDGHHANFDSSLGTAVASYFSSGFTTVVGANGGTNANFGIIGRGNTFGVVGESTIYGEQYASVYGWGATQNTRGVMGVSKDFQAVFGYSQNGFGVQGYTQRADKQWGLITFERTYSGAGYFPFTGSHIAFGKGEYEIGDIVDAVSGKLINVDQSYMEVSTSNTAKSKSVIGVVTTVDSDVEKNLRGNSLLCHETVTKNGKMEHKEYKTYKEEYKPYIDKLVSEGYKEIGINSLGEGGINVCSEGGNIEIGDYICSSSIKGKGMKQDDDLLHNYTVAKALEAVDWSKESGTVKMISCTYHCG